MIFLVVACVGACGTRLPESAFLAGAGGGPEITTTQTLGSGVSVGPSMLSGSAGSAGSSYQTGGSGGVPGPTGLGVSAPVGDTAGNQASDVGVSATTLRLGLIVSQTNILGTDAFSPSLYGAQAYVQSLNARGGVHGRRVQLVTCDDQSSATGNQQCVRGLIADGIFAFIGNTIFNYDAASTVSHDDVPDVGGQPIDNSYDTYQHLYSIYGDQYPRNGTPGEDGKLYGGTEDYHYFKLSLGLRHAAVVYYNESDSQRFAAQTEAGLRAEGYQVLPVQVDFGLPNFDAAVLDMKNAGVDSIWDTIDNGGNEALCAAMDRDGLHVKAKVQTVQAWRQDVAAYHAPCRDSVYVTSKTLAYSDTANPTIAAFRRDMATYEPAQVANLAEWMLEGWAGVQWLDDALQTCPIAPTRRCLEGYLNRPASYDGHGIFEPRNFVPVDFTNPANRTAVGCVSAARWSDAARTFVQVSDLRTDCYQVPQLAYSAT